MERVVVRRIYFQFGIREISFARSVIAETTSSALMWVVSIITASEAG
jgi:hypothetical protein